jgi:hypothetical protein
MRSLLVLFVLVFSSQVFASSWNDLEIGEGYTLKQELTLVSNSPGQSQFHIPAGTKLVHSDLFPLDMISVMLYQFKLPNCPGNDFETQMEIIPVQETSPLVEIGAQVASNCLLEIFIETRDIYSSSIVK